YAGMWEQIAVRREGGPPIAEPARDARISWEMRPDGTFATNEPTLSDRVRWRVHLDWQFKRHDRVWMYDKHEAIEQLNVDTHDELELRLFTLPGDYGHRHYRLVRV